MVKAPKSWIPSIPEVAREAIIVVAGALVAAWIVGNFPPIKAYIKDNWGDAQH